MLNTLAKRLREYRHRWAHRLHLTTGYVVSGWAYDRLWIGFRCDKCSAVNHAHVADEKPGAVGPLTPPKVWTR